jgi:hypothetical protein
LLIDGIAFLYRPFWNPAAKDGLRYWRQAMSLRFFPGQRWASSPQNTLCLTSIGSLFWNIWISRWSDDDARLRLAAGAHRTQV